MSELLLQLVDILVQLFGGCNRGNWGLISLLDSGSFTIGVAEGQVLGIEAVNCVFTIVIGLGWC